MATFGDTTAGTNAAALGGDRGWAGLFTLSEGATLNTAYWYKGTGTAAGGNSKVLIYTDGGSDPGTLVATSSAVAVTSGVGWLSASISGSLAAGDYYIVLATDSGTGGGYVMTDTTGTAVKLNTGSFNYASPPSSWPGTSATYPGYTLNAYIDYTPAGGSTILRQMMAHHGG